MGRGNGGRQREKRGSKEERVRFLTRFSRWVRVASFTSLRWHFISSLFDDILLLLSQATVGLLVSVRLNMVKTKNKL